MEIIVNRTPSAHGATISRIVIDGAFQCFGCEDEIREVPGQDVGKWKIWGKTAIPAGRYKVTLGYSEHFKKIVPHVMDVPGFEGILIHWGNTPADTEGCLLTGVQNNVTYVSHSVLAWNALMERITPTLENGGGVWITYVNPVTNPPAPVAVT